MLLLTLVNPIPSYKINIIGRVRSFTLSIGIYIPLIFIPFLVQLYVFSFDSFISVSPLGKYLSIILTLGRIVTSHSSLPPLAIISLFSRLLPQINTLVYNSSQKYLPSSPSPPPTTTTSFTTIYPSLFLEIIQC